MAETTIELDLSKSPVYEAGAVLISLLALPEGDETERGNLMASLCHLALKARFSPDDAETWQPQLIRPGYALRGEKQVHKDVKTLQRSLRDRMIAARMAIPFLQKVVGHPPKLPKDVERLTLDAMSILARRDLGLAGDERERGNEETRIWRPSLPVIHLAVPIAILLQSASSVGEEIHLGHILMDRRLVEWVVNQSIQYAALIDTGHALPGKAPSLIKVSLRG